MIYSGFVGKKMKWIGCGSREELRQMHEQMQEDEVVEDRTYSGDLTLKPATKEEIARFKAESGTD